MAPLRPGIRRLFRLATGRPADAVRDVTEEMRLHIELRAEQLVRGGLDPAAARREAERMFALSDASVRALYATAVERTASIRLRERWEALLQDTRYAARGLVRDPWMAAFVVGTLALGIGANVTAFGLLDRLLLRGPAYVRDPERLARLYARIEDPHVGTMTTAWLPWATYTTLREGMRQFTAVGAYGVRDAMVGTGRDGRMRRVGSTDGAFFDLLGARPLVGRFFAPGDDAAALGARVVVSEDLWRREFGADPAALGRALVINDVASTIVGVAPAGFGGPDLTRVDAWILVDSRTAAWTNWRVLGRMAPGASTTTVGDEAATVHRAAAASGPRSMRNATILARPIRFGETADEPVEASLARWLSAVSAIILLIAFANVVNLLLVRLAKRQRELAIRVALGSGRGRVMRLLALEGVLLAATGGALSLLVAGIIEPLLRAQLFAGEAGYTFSLFDPRLLITLASVTLATGLCLALIPALQAGSPRMTAALRSGAPAGPGRSRLRSALTVAQAALSVVLLMGTGLFIRSMANARAVDLGIHPEGVTFADVRQDLPRTDFATRAAAERALFRRLAETVRRVPGVEHAAVAVGRPLDGGSFAVAIRVDGIDSIPELPGGGPYISAVGGDYFATVGTRLLAGRAFTDADREGSEPVVIVGETMARLLFPGREATQGCVWIGPGTVPCSRVVGVAADVHRQGLTEEPSLQFYVPLGQAPWFSGASLLVRAREGEPVSLTVLRQAMLDADPSITAVDIRPLSETLEGTIRPLRIGLVTFGLSGALALLVAALGMYSLMSYLVAWRTKEIGVRLALGATQQQITLLVVSSGAGLAAVGVALGLGLSLAGGRWLEPRLFRTSASDPTVLAIVAGTLLLVAFLAAWLPARRAVRISPLEALRAE